MNTHELPTLLACWTLPSGNRVALSKDGSMWRVSVSIQNTMDHPWVLLRRVDSLQDAFGYADRIYARLLQSNS